MTDLAIRKPFDIDNVTVVNGKTTEVLPVNDLEEPATLEMRDYQVQGSAWLYAHKRAILADDAGLGKTIQAAIAAVRPVMITCPSYLVLQWADVLAKEFPNDTVSVAGIGSREQRHRALTPDGTVRAPIGKAPADWTIVSTDMHRGYYLPDACTWIIDEAHHFRNRDAERTKRADDYAERVERVIMLTATPVYKDVTNLWSLLHMLDPETWTSYWNFVGQWAKTAGDGQGWGANRVVGVWNPELLEQLLEPYMLRRTYRDAGLSLPDMIDKDVVLSLSEVERKLYLGVKNNFVYEDIPLSSQGEVMHTLRRITVNTKIDAVKQIIDDNPKQPTLVYAWYQDSAEDCALAIGGTYISGATHSPDQRMEAALKSVRDGKPIVATISSMSEGVNLSMCKQLIYMEEDYVPGSMYQSERRTKRWTEDDRPILNYNIRCKNTIDQDVHRAVTDRRGSAQSVLKDALS